MDVYSSEGASDHITDHQASGTQVTTPERYVHRVAWVQLGRIQHERRRAVGVSPLRPDPGRTVGLLSRLDQGRTVFCPFGEPFGHFDGTTAAGVGQKMPVFQPDSSTRHQPKFPLVRQVSN